MNIFIKIKNSIYNPEYYGEVSEKPLSYSLNYYLLFALIFALAFTIVVTIRFIPIVNLLYERVPGISNYFPQDLKISIKNGKVSTNVHEPYFIKMPQELKNNSARLNSADVKINGSSVQMDTANMDNLVVIDTKDKFDIDTFNSYKTFMLLTSDSVVYMNKNNQISINSLAGVKDFTLNRGAVADFINRIKPFFVIAYPLVFAGGYVFGFVSVFAEMIYLIFGALLIWLVASIKGIKTGYKKSYQLGMHLITPVIIITSIVYIIPGNFTIPFLFTILLILSAILNLNKDALHITNTPGSVASAA